MSADPTLDFEALIRLRDQYPSSEAGESTPLSHTLLDAQAVMEMDDPTLKRWRHGMGLDQ